MYANVVVLTYQSPDIGSYTYKVPKHLTSKIQPGQLVSVPFGKREPMGIVVWTGSDPARVSAGSDPVIDIKPIGSIILETPMLLPYQIELLKWMSKYYHAPTVNCLEAMLPEIPKRLSDYQVVRSSGKQEQTLVLVPSINLLPQTLAQFPKAKNHLLYHNQLKTSEKFESWLKIKSGQADFIFGSRSAIFTPCPNLKKIIIFDEHDGAYKDERSPYFDTLTVAEKICQLAGSELEIIDSSPKITTNFSHQKIIKSPSFAKASEGKRSIKIVSMKEEKEAGNFSPLSQEAISQIRKVISQKGKVLLFLNKKTESGQIYCKNCKYQEFVRTQPHKCPNCGSADIWFNSLNINSLAAITRRIVGSIPIRLFAEDYRLQTTDYRLSSIDIATASIFYTPVLSKYNLVCYIQIDSLLNIPDFTTPEKVFNQIGDLWLLSKEKGILIIQTNNPESQLLANAVSGNYKSFFTHQIGERKVLSYPPYALLVKLTIKGKDDQKIKSKAQDLVQKLKSLQSTIHNLPSIVVLGPYKPSFWHPIASYNIIFKVPIKNYSLKTREGAVKEISSLLDQVPRNWQITIEPDSLN